ncbi:Homologous-pairing protein 2 like protein [Fukomys damarensis]|uniref:Homologous-pairing protein 2 homolog n=1 Tax=Fukomys damarensis TaxID=885580 RepID=A0A091DDF9_FUKDA|nr:Homologous-pairing protein 2 like protein [Fukomys damarensis]
MSKGRAEAGAGVPGVLLRYLQEQNRPYSAQDVFGNLQREHGLGKADQFDTVSDADLQSMDAKIVALTAKVQGLQQSCRHMEAELKELTSALTTPEMQREVEQLKAECAGYTERLRGIRAAPARVTPAEKEQVGSGPQVHREQQRYCREWRMRKRLVSSGDSRAGAVGRSRVHAQLVQCGSDPQAMELSAAILEGYPKSKKQFFEEVGIETDEDHHVVPPEP